MADRGSEIFELGPCCGCGVQGAIVQSIVFLPVRAQIPGHGWGCFVCGLPNDGACYVVCDDCVAHGKQPVWACAGYPATEGRVPIAELSEPFVHDDSRHWAYDCVHGL